MGTSDTPTTIANQALSSIGNRSTIASLAEQSNEAIQANMHFNNTRDELLRMAPWDGAFNSNVLQLITATPGTPENPTNAPLMWNKTLPMPPWAYEYTYPADCLRACYVIPQFMTGFAGNDDGASRIEIIFPLLNFAGIVPDRPWEQVGRLFECVALSNVDDMRRSLRRDPVPEIFRRD